VDRRHSSTAATPDFAWDHRPATEAAILLAARDLVLVTNDHDSFDMVHGARQRASGPRHLRPVERHGVVAQLAPALTSG
jgi:hypothetical protein